MYYFNFLLIFIVILLKNIKKNLPILKKANEAFVNYIYNFSNLLELFLPEFEESMLATSSVIKNRKNF